MNREVNEKVKSKYNIRVKKLLRSQLNGGNAMAGMNAWSVGIIRYGSGVLKNDRRIEIIDIKTRKLMTMNGSLHPRRNVGRLYLARKERGRGLITCEECVNVEVQNLE